MSPRTEDTPPEGRPTITPTPPRLLLVAVLLGGMAGFVLGPMVQRAGWTPMHVPWTAPAALALFAAVLGVLARRMYRTVRVHHEPVSPDRGLYSVVIGKAAALVGAGVAGGYLVFGLSFLPAWQIGGMRARVIGAAASMLAGVAVCVAGWALERACLIPPDDHDRDRRADDTSE